MSQQQRNNLIGIPREASSSQLLVKDEAGELFIATSVSVTEKLSQLSHIEVAVLNLGMDVSSWLGQHISCQIFDQISPSREPVRVYKGVVTGVKILFDADQGSCIALTVEPWMALLRYSRHYRVFQNKSTQEIVSEIFTELKFSGKYQVKKMPKVKREYCLQYNETDLAFVSRLLAQEGVHFYFERDSDILILQDAALPFDDGHQQDFDYFSLPSGDNPLLNHWAPAFCYHSGVLQLAAYNPASTALVEAESKTKSALPGSHSLTEFRYPHPSISGDFSDINKASSQRSKAQQDSDYSLVNASTESYLICSGNYLKLTSHPDLEQLDDYLVISGRSIYHVDEKGGLSNHTDFDCILSSLPYYPPLLEKPSVSGMHSAVVAGASAGESTCDKEGRIRIKFHWDDVAGDKTSCWVRVAQSMAGSGYGLQFIPRAGQEVLVSFLEGDIDRPIVTGSLYNSKHKAPYAEAETTKSGIKTQLKGESNELRFDDKKDSEELYLHAAKDYFLEVKNDRKITVAKDVDEQVEGEKSVQVKKDISTKTDANYSLDAGKSISEKAQNITLHADKTIVLKVGSSQIEISASKIEIKSSEISIKGTAKVDVTANNVNLKAQIALKAGSANTELSGDIGVKVKGGTMAELSGGAMTTVKGGMVMVN
ncbi:hypothetical protein A9R01_06800 ['Osedax' symbiont bacterium Rs2_46_30_T18]|nr:hypothetical protein A9R01_06800 ['Osedax' symbiont bacterium Rs2_46_30_T18]